MNTNRPPAKAVAADGIPSCVYDVDAAHRIVSLGRGWAEFAVGNHGSHLVQNTVVGRSLWDFVGDATTREVYRQIIRRVLEGEHVICVPFRCDSPTERRHMQLEARLVDRERCRFTSRIRRRETRDAVALLDPQVDRTAEYLRACSWCKRIAVNFGTWVEVESAVAQLRLFERASLPRLTHGICPSCLHSLSAEFLSSR